MAILERVEIAAEDIRYAFYCPGCGYDHWFRAVGPHPVWHWNENWERPTVSPSILTEGLYRCHLFMQAGELIFLNDCTHALAGRTVPMEEID